MNIVHRLVLAGVLSVVIFFGCGEKEEPIVLEIGINKVGMNEYENFFAKNIGGIDTAKNSSIEAREKFLDLLTNYKLKLQDAYDNGFDKDPEITQELKEYRSSLAASFMVDREVTEPGVELMYKRRKEEIRAQHILLALKPTASPEDTMKAYTKAMDIIKEAKSGAPFESLVQQYSEDQSAKTNNGDVYYFTSGQLTSAFESAAYGMQKGDLSKTPVRSASGYHIIKIIDRKPSQFMIKVRHIMTRFKVSATDSADTTDALIRMRALQDSLKSGWKFADLATKLSEDAGSAPEGGDLGWFERRRWVQPFDEAAFTLSPGNTSGIVKTPFGFHLIYCDSVKDLPPFAEMKDELKKRYQQVRFNEDYDSYLKNLKSKYHFVFHEDVFQSFVSALDTNDTVDDSAWSGVLPKELLDKPLFSIKGKSYILDSVIAIINRKMEFRGTSLRDDDLRVKVDRIIENLLLDEQSAGLENEYPEFASLMREYKDGIILFKAEQLQVWNRVAVSDSALKLYYTKNRERFKFPNRVAYSAIEIDSDTLALMVYDSLLKGADFSEMAERYNTDPDMKARKGAFELAPVTQDDFTIYADSLQAGDITEPMEMTTGGYVIMKVTKKESERVKTYEEAGAELSNAFQEYESKRLEKEWLDRVKEKYPVKQHKELLQSAFQSSRKP
ncbi:MAG: hypothetical protein EPO24_04955 [Bacteroidetes bacterium]|nr:MAG: hypothetical protein EPO24_04955 [Bacteroidota bacterium]